MANRNDPFFTRLTNLFRSGPAIQRRVKGYDYKSYYDNQLVRGNLGYRGPFPFGRESSPFSVLGSYGILDRTARYSEFAEMEYQPEIAAALNIFADETAAGDEKGKAFHLYSKNPEVKKALEELFYDILNIDFNLRPWIRNLVKYGDFFLYNEVIPDIGIVNVQPIPVNELEREEGFDQRDPYAVRYKWITRGNRYLENWQITHMRILGNDLFLPYGTSILEPARRIWRQLVMMEDAMLVYRVVRSPERRVFYIDVGNVAPNDVPSFMEAVKQTMRSKDVVNRQDGRMDQRFNPLSIDEDYFIPVRGGQTGTKIDTLQGGQNATAVDDVKYLQQKLFAAIQVPKPYLNFDENLCILGNTEIPLLDGSTRTIESLATEWEAAKDKPALWVYSVDAQTGAPKAGKVLDVWKTKEVNRIVRVTLDNGRVIETTTNHPFLLRSGEYLEAENLQPHMSLMPIYRKKSSVEAGDKLNGYEMVFDNASKKWIYTHQMVLQTHGNISRDDSLIKETKSVIHHRNFNKLDNSPENLLRMGFRAHGKLHGALAKANLASSENRNLLRNLWKDENSKLVINHLSGVNHAWQTKNVESRKEAVRQANRRYNKVKIMHEQLSEMRKAGFMSGASAPNYRARPAVDAIQKVILEKKLLSPTAISVELGCSMTGLREVVANNFGTSMRKYISSVAAKNKMRIRKASVSQLNLASLADIASVCKTRTQFYIEGKVSRETFIRYLSLQGINQKKWFEVNLNKTNHKIVSVEIIDTETPLAVFDLTVEGHHNFLLGAGVVVHNSAKASLAQQDVRFSRTISVLQRVILSELNKMAMVHLYTKGFDGEDLIAFELRLSNPSTVAMQQKLEAMSTKFDIAGKAKETKLVDQDWIQKKILDLTDDDIIKIEAGVRRDKIREVEIEAIAVKENLPEKNTTTDPFDPRNYVMPGADVKKNSPLGEPIDGNANTNAQPFNMVSNMQAVATSGVSVAGQPSASPDASVGLPIKATPFLSAAKHNDRRRVGMSGKGNLSMPDFKDMLSGNNKYLTDINDKETLNLKSQFSLSEQSEKSDFEFDYKPPPVISRDMKNLMQKLDDHFAHTGGRRNKKFLTENEVKLDDLNDDRLFEMDMVGDEILIENTIKDKKEEENDDLDLSNL